MKIVIIGNGLVGARLMDLLRGGGHQVVCLSPNFGGDAQSVGQLPEALVEAEVLVDVASPPSFGAGAVLDFFAALSRNLVSAAAAARVGHHVSLSMVGISRVGGGYFRAKAAQEDLIRASWTPYTIVRSTQSLEYIDRSLQLGASSGIAVRLPIALVQPIAADDLADAIATIATSPAKNGTVEVAGPEPIFLHELARLILSGHEVPRPVIASAQARYFGALLDERSLMPGPDPLVGSTALRDWLRQLIMPG